MTKFITLLLLITLFSMTTVACTPQSLPRAAYTDDGDFMPPPSGPGLVAKDRSPIPDVPLPIGFVAVPSRSHSSFDGQVRHVRHVYQGRSNTGEVVNFYRLHLPRRGWNSLGRERDADGSTVMRYNKGSESLRVRIAERHSVITTIVTIEPRN